MWTSTTRFLMGAEELCALVKEVIRNIVDAVKLAAAAFQRHPGAKTHSTQRPRKSGYGCARCYGVIAIKRPHFSVFQVFLPL